MRRLQRDPVPPGGLDRYCHGRDKWSNTCPTQEERAHIWARIDAMQGARCAYCEGPMDGANRHIEHFRQRGRYPQGTFDWNNLFGSCNRTGTCGDHKDKCGPYPHEDLIKPDVEDPEAFLVFLPKGQVEPRATLSDRDRRRALETIRILGLDGALNEIRRAQVAGYLETAEFLAGLAEEYSVEEWLPLLEAELQATADGPFATAIRHVLTPQGA